MESCNTISKWVHRIIAQDFLTANLGLMNALNKMAQHRRKYALSNIFVFHGGSTWKVYDD